MQQVLRIRRSVPVLQQWGRIEVGRQQITFSQVQVRELQFTAVQSGILELVMAEQRQPWVSATALPAPSLSFLPER